MNQNRAYKKHVELINKEDFISFFSSREDRKSWFSDKELDKYDFTRNAKSLAGRYLIKKAICDHIRDHTKMHEIEIINNSMGKPEVIFGENIRPALEKNGIKKILCSISHSRSQITGMTIFCF